MLLGALIVALGVIAAQTAMLFWSFKRAARASDKLLSTIGDMAAVRRQLDAHESANSDLSKAVTALQSDKNRLLFTVDTLEDQRDALLKDAFENATPSSVAVAIRNALERLRTIPK